MGGTGTNSEKERCFVHCPELEQIVIGVPNVKKAIEVAKEFAEKVEAIELCGYFGKEGRDAEVAKALGNKFRVGAVKYVTD
jgi:hypothetical protein